MKLFSTRRNIILSIIGFFIILLVVLGLSYAYYGALIGDEARTQITGDGDSLDSLIFEEGDPLSLSMTQHNFGEGAANLTSVTYPSVTLVANETNNTASSSYYVYLEVTSNTFVYSTGVLEIAEIIMTVNDPDGNLVTNIDGLEYVTSGGVTGFDITTFNGIIPIKENQLIETTDSVVGEIQTWEINLYIINLPTDQNINAEKSLSANIIIQKDKMPEPIVEYLIDNLTEADGFIQHTPELTNSAGDNNYRFSGSDLIVKNYIIFNDELWRIIGIYDEQVKIIRNESIGSYKWDVSGSNKWEGEDTTVVSDDADINQLLNNYYLNSTTAPAGLADCDVTAFRGACDFTTTGLSEESRSMIQKSSYFIGEVLSDYTYSAKNFFDDEVVQTVNEYTVGLIYPSDYLYSSSKDEWETLNFNGTYSENDNHYYNNTNLLSNNWLYKGDGSGSSWSIVASLNNYVWNLSGLGIFQLGNSSGGGNIFPVLYLNADVKVVSGIGIENSPFQLVS